MIYDMKASELRCGNYVYFEDELLKFDFEMGWNFDYIKPIPLTEEWLLKFGFKEIKRYTHDFEEIIYGKSIIVGSENHCETLTISMPFKVGFIGDYLSDQEYTLNIDIKHVNQLQNLYFALTNEEL
jgi:hypothetical protein